LPARTIAAKAAPNPPQEMTVKVAKITTAPVAIAQCHHASPLGSRYITGVMFIDITTK
jgi:hypothetical protein